MRRYGWFVVSAVLLLAACGSNGSHKASTTSSEPSTSTDPVTSSVPGTTVGSTTTTVGTTTSQAHACLVPEGSIAAHAPLSLPDPANILTSVTATNDGCTGDVTLTFRPNHNRPPSCGAKYAPGPFTEDASGKAVTVAGSAFLVVRCEPARSYDPLSGATTYRAPASKHIPISRTGPVQDMASTGDFEGVMTWVVGVDRQRPFTAGATSGGVFVVTIV